MCKLLEVSLTHDGAPEMEGEILKLQPILAISFVFAFLWGLAGNVTGERAADVDSLIRNIFEDCSEARVSAFHSSCLKLVGIKCIIIFLRWKHCFNETSQGSFARDWMSDDMARPDPQLYDNLCYHKSVSLLAYKHFTGLLIRLRN